MDNAQATARGVEHTCKSQLGACYSTRSTRLARSVKAYGGLSIEGSLCGLRTVIYAVRMTFPISSGFTPRRRSPVADVLLAGNMLHRIGCVAFSIMPCSLVTNCCGVHKSGNAIIAPYVTSLVKDIKHGSKAYHLLAEGIVDFVIPEFDLNSGVASTSFCLISHRQ